MQNQAMAKQALEAIDQTNAQIRSRADKALIDESRATADALQDAAREKQDKALDALAMAVNCGGTAQQPAMQQLTKVWQNKNNGKTDGLQDFIKSRKPAQQ